MKALVLLILMICGCVVNCFSQEDTASLFMQNTPLPFSPNLEDISVTECYESSTLGTKKMDNLISEIQKLENTLSKLNKRFSSINLDDYTFLYASQYTLHIAYDGFTSQDYCITDSLLGKKNDWNLWNMDLYSDKATCRYGQIFLTITETSHYLGNNEWWTTRKYYLIREDEYLKFLQQ